MNGSSSQSYTGDRKPSGILNSGKRMASASPASIVDKAAVASPDLIGTLLSLSSSTAILKKRKYDHSKPISCTLEEDSGHFVDNRNPNDVPLDVLLDQVQRGNIPAPPRHATDGSVRIPVPASSGNPYSMNSGASGLNVKRKTSALAERLDSKFAAVSATTKVSTAPQKSMASTSGGIISLPTNLPAAQALMSIGAAPKPDRLTTDASSRAVPLSTNRNDHIMFIGSAKLDSAKLLANSLNDTSTSIAVKPSTAANMMLNRVVPSALSKHISAPKSVSKPISNATQSKPVSKNNALDAEVLELLNRKSSHYEEAEDEWFDDYGKRMDKLAKREYKMAKNEATTCIRVPAFHCLDCGLITEAMGPLCRPRGHTVNSVSATKRFFECSTCLRKDYTLGVSGLVSPSLPCKICGVLSWRACGIKGTELGSVSSRDSSERLITSATDWTSRKDLERIKVMSGNE
jgi:hypothetical protein